MTGTKKNFFVEANARNVYAKYQLHKSKQFVRRFVKIFFFFENLPFLGPQQPIKISDQDEDQDI